jgi:hypothetical protein
MLKILLSIALGIGIAGQSAFYNHLILNLHWRLTSLAIAGILGLLCYHYAVRKSFKKEKTPANFWIGYVVLGFLSTALIAEALKYPFGGWDAWSCWNLKAKFIFLGKEHWKDMLDPGMWRSNTQYPLLLPCIITWFWDVLGKAYQFVPMTASIAFTLLSAAILIFGLARMTKNILPGSLLAAAAFSIPFVITLSISQYSDILVGLYLLCALVCLLADEMILCGLFIGLLSFTKTEGTVAAGLLTLLILFVIKKQSKPFLTALFIAAIPTILFQMFLAPKNEAFINGLMSVTQPSNFDRLKYIGAFTPIEFLSFKWHGLWVLGITALLIWKEKSFGKELKTIGIFMVSYLGIVIIYYYVNTFFEIGWWMQNTLNRILFALLPSFLLWLGLSLKRV